MSQTAHPDLEGGNNPDGDQAQSASNLPSQPSQGESSFGDSSGPLFSMYYKTAKEEDNKMAERWQKDADGILFFTGLFSAAVAALLSVTVQDLRPNSQDTSAFYLGNIYGVLADPNATRASISSPVAKPPPFSPPRYAVWVNSLWFLSLVMSVSCAMWATSLHQWARRYIRLTQPERCSPEKQARKRAFFANGVEKMHISWAVEGLPTLLHLSLFLFFGGLVIFLFNIDHEVFISVVWWIGIFSTVYGSITLLPLIRRDSPYYTPLSIPAWFPYAGIRYLTFKVLAFTTNRYDDFKGRKRTYLTDRYRGWMLGGMEKAAEKAAFELSPMIDTGILSWTIGALGDDDSLEKFFEAIPGFFNSKLVNYHGYEHREHLPIDIWISLSNAMDGFMCRTLSSNSVIDSVKHHRLQISMNAINLIHKSGFPSLFGYVFPHHWGQVPPTIEIAHTLERWWTSNDQYTARYTQGIVSRILATVKERDDRWVELAARVYGLPECDIRDIVTDGDDSVSLAILIHLIRIAFRSDVLWGGLVAFTKFDIRNTLSGLQNDFCTLWNEVVQEAEIQGTGSTPVGVLISIRGLYSALHQGTNAVPSLSIGPLDPILYDPSCYRLCDIASHRLDSIAHLHPLTQLADPDASPHHSASQAGDSTVLRQLEVEQAIIISETPSSPIPSEIGDSSQASAATLPALPVHISPRPTDVSPLGAAAAALQDIPPAATLSHPLEGTTQQDIVVPCAVNEILSTASTPAPTPTLAPVPESTLLVLNKSLEPRGPGAASAFNPLPPASSVIGFSIPVSPSPPRLPPSPNTESFALVSTTTPSRTAGNATLPRRVRARGLVNTGSMCFTNAVLQILVHSPQSCNLFRELGGLKGRGGAEGTEIGVTPLVDATVRFFEEFVSKEKELPSTQQPSQQAAGGKPREDEGVMKEHNAVDPFEPMCMYDAMKEKRRLKTFLDGQQQDAEVFFRLYLDALDEELLAPLTSTSGHKLTTAALGVEEREVSGQADAENQDFMVESFESPLMRIFNGKSRSTVRAPNQQDTATIEDWRLLQLDIQHDSVHAIEGALARISHFQPVQLGPSDSSEASQQVLIEVLPPVLVLHLKRFLYDVAAGGIVKISKPVQFAPELEIPLEIMASVSRKSAEPVHYKLYGVLYHHGKSAGSGHYTVDVLHRNGDIGNGETWLHIDDEVVSAVRPEDVFGSGDDMRVDDRCAYMLFYCRTGPIQT